MWASTQSVKRHAYDNDGRDLSMLDVQLTQLLNSHTEVEEFNEFVKINVPYRL